MELEKLPDPVPSVVFDPAIVGVCVVAQQTPRTVMAAPPSELIVPPLVAVVDATDATAVVVTPAVRTGVTCAVIVLLVLLPAKAVRL